MQGTNPTAGKATAGGNSSGAKDKDIQPIGSRLRSRHEGNPTAKPITKEREKDVCGHCDMRRTDTGKGSDGLLCDYCGYWAHASCEGLTAEGYRMLCKLSDIVPSMSYYCVYNRCKHVAGEILKQLGPLRERVEENTQRISLLEDEVRDQNKRLEANVEIEVGKCLGSTIEDQVRKVWGEEKERAVRAKNVLIMNVKEETRPDSTVRKDWDTKFVRELLTDVLGLDDEITRPSKMKNVVRMGKYDESTSAQKPRLVKVMFDHEDTAKSVLHSANKLGNANEADIKVIKIFRDLSKDDRDKRRKLVLEMKAGNEELKKKGIKDKKCIIRDEEVVTIRIDLRKQQSF